MFNLIDDYADIDAYTSYDTATFSNAGLLEKTGGTGTSAIYAVMTNTGSIVAASGTLAFYSGGSFGGSLSGAGYIAFSGGTNTLTATAATANLLVNGGTLDVGINETVGSLAMSTGGTLAVTGSNTVTVSGAFSMAGQGGGLSLVTLASGGTLKLAGAASFDTINAYGPEISGPGTLSTSAATTLATQTTNYVDLYLSAGATWTNSGTATIGGQIDFGVFAADTASFINQAGGVFNLIDDYADIDAYTSYDTATFSNAGLLEKTGGTGTSAIYATVTNTGSIVAASGTMAFYSGGSFGGSLSGAGYIAFSGGSSTLTATAATANLLVNGGTLDVGVNETVGSLAISSGELAVTGSDTMTVSGAFSAAGGGGQHEITLVSGATLELNGSASFDTVNAYGPSILGPGTLYTAGATTLATQAAAYVDLYLGGRATWTNSGNVTVGGQIDFGVYAADTASFINQAGGVFNLTDDYADIDAYTSYDTATFSNAGLLEKTGGTATSAIYAKVTNTGSIVAASGTMAFYSGGSFGGSLSGAGYIAFSGGTSTLTATAATANLLVNGGTLDVGVNETVGSLAISSGELAVTGSDTMTVSGAFSAAGGGGQHEITLVSGATLKLNGSASFDTVNAYGPSILGPGTLYTAGATTLATQAAAYVDLYLGGGGTWTNSGIATIGGQIDFGLTAADTASFVNQAGGVVNLTDDYASIVPYTSYDSATFSNAGLLEKTGNTGVSAIDATLTNTGTMLVSSGTLSLPVLTNLSGTTLTGGTFEATAGAVLELANNTTIATAAATIILSGTGSALQSLNTSTNTQVGVDSTLYDITTTGALRLLGGRNFTVVANAGNFIDNGQVQLGGGTLTATSLTVETGAKLLGFGTVATGVASTGLVDANGGLLLLSSALTGASALEADAGATLQLAANTAPTTDSTTITLNGIGSEIEWGNTTPTKIEASLTTISATGTFDVLGSRGYTTTLAITDSGLLQLSGGTFASASLSVGSSGKLLGFGTITPAVADTGTVEASGTGDVLKLSTGASGAGTLIADNGATLELAGSTTAGAVSDNGTLKLDGITLTATSLTVATGAKLLGFGTVAKGVASTGLVDANGGLLLLSSALNGASALEADGGATLQLGANTAPTTASTTITLNGAGSEIEWGSTTPTKIEASLTTISATGTFDVLGSRGYTTTLAITDSGLLQLSGGTFASASLSIGSGGKLLGFGTITPAVADTGTVEASGAGDVLKLSTGASGTGTLIADNGATLELAGSTTAGAVSDNGTLKLDGITLAATSLTVASGALVTGSGTVTLSRDQRRHHRCDGRHAQGVRRGHRRRDLAEHRGRHAGACRRHNGQRGH